MKVLWITNVELPGAAEYFGRKTVVGGWMDYSSTLLSKRENVDLHILSMCINYPLTKIGEISYAGFDEDSAELVIDENISSYNPDVIHIWGSEYNHAYQAINISERMGYIGRTIVSIQGLVSEYANYYFAGLPEKVKKKRTLYEVLKNKSLNDLRENMRLQGEKEVQLLTKARNCIGRTDWDYACVKKINNAINYYKCNEILRKSFYENHWEYDKCEPYMIAFSQAHYPIKGLHILLNALGKVKKKFPEVKVRVLGKSPYESNGIKDRLRKDTYKEYIKKLIKENSLSENVEWVGECDEQQMIRHYKKANVFVCSSTIENSSNSICEAMLLGMPVIASDVGGVRSLLEPGKEGVLFNIDDMEMLAKEIVKVFEDTEYAKKLGDNARKRAGGTHDCRYCTDELIKIYDEIMLNEKA